jgi:hypothetical protein
MTNIIGDIAGQYKALMALIKKMPEGEIICVGDLMDRGPQSKEVMDFCMNTPNIRVILGNHEHMMLDALTRGRFYGNGVWLWNGGGATIASFDKSGELANPVPQEYLDWIAKLPKYITIDDVFIAHSFVPYFEEMSTDEAIEEACDFGNRESDKGETTIVWNRGFPWRDPDNKFRLQICGHNSQFGLRQFTDEEGVVGICLDDSRHNKLTGLCLETMKIYQQEYI